VGVGDFTSAAAGHNSSSSSSHSHWGGGQSLNTPTTIDRKKKDLDERDYHIVIFCHIKNCRVLHHYRLICLHHNIIILTILHKS
jgi:hypothetical protein